MNSSACPFCNLPKERILVETHTAVAFFDGYPITDGHTLVIPKRHIANLFDLPEDELRAVWSLVAKMRATLKDQFRPDGLDVGLNEGEAAGHPKHDLWLALQRDERRPVEAQRAI